MSDLIHTVVGIPQTMNVSKALQILKGASSRELFKRKPNFKIPKKTPLESWKIFQNQWRH